MTDITGFYGGFYGFFFYFFIIFFCKIFVALVGLDGCVTRIDEVYLLFFFVEKLFGKTKKNRSVDSGGFRRNSGRPLAPTLCLRHFFFFTFGRLEKNVWVNKVKIRF